MVIDVYSFFACICRGIVPYLRYVVLLEEVQVCTLMYVQYRTYIRLCRYIHIIYVRWETPSNEMCVVSIEIRDKRRRQILGHMGETGAMDLAVFPHKARKYFQIPPI